MGKTQRKIQKKEPKNEQRNFLMNVIEEDLLLIALFIVPFIVFITKEAHWIKTVFFIISLIGFVTKINKWKSLTGTVMIFLTIITTPKYLFTLASQKLILGNFVALIVLLLLWNAIVLVFTIIIHKNQFENDAIINTFPPLLRRLHTKSELAKKIFFKIKLLNPFIMYCLIVYTAIIVFGKMYGLQETFNNEIDKYYFSAVTFFTVGYGDFSPTNNNSKIIAIFQMAYSNLTTVVYIPLLIAFFYSYMEKSRLLLKQHSKD